MHQDVGSSPAWHGGLKVLALPSCGIGHNLGSDLIPGQGKFHVPEPPKKKKTTGIPTQFHGGSHKAECLMGLDKVYPIIVLNSIFLLLFLAAPVGMEVPRPGIKPEPQSDSKSLSQASLLTRTQRCS